jgi:type II secretory pathway component PulF
MFIPFYGVFGGLLIVAGVHYIGFLPRDFPGISRISRRFDSALVMRALALAVCYQWPVNKTIWLLARIYPKRGMRGRLIIAGRLVDNGIDWCDSLFQAGIIQRLEYVVLKAAQRVGNVEWALDEMADGSVRRLVYRSRLVLNIAFPVVLLFFGLFAALFVVGLFVPLIGLIQGLV